MEHLNSIFDNKRILDILVPTYNRTALLYRLIESAINSDILKDGTYIVIIDNGTNKREFINNIGYVDTFELVMKLNNNNILYKRLNNNEGVGGAWEWYFNSNSIAKYFLPIPDKYIFINSDFIIPSLALLESNIDVSLVINPLMVNDRTDIEYVVDSGVSGKLSDIEFFHTFISNNALQHLALGGASIVRASVAVSRALPRRLHLNNFGLDDGFGIDADLLFNVVRGNSVAFLNYISVVRYTQEGGTERYPLTFAYCYYLYLKRVCRELVLINIINVNDMRRHLGFFILLMLRGYSVTLNPVHGTESEVGTSRIQKHLRHKFIIFIIFEVISLRLILSLEAKKMIINFLFLGIYSRYKYYIKAIIMDLNKAG